MITIKNLYSFTLLFLMLTLTACGGGSDDDKGNNDGGKNTFTVGGSISGLSGSGLLLQNNTGDDLAVTSNGNFAFSSGQVDGAAYVVTIKSQPNEQACTISNNSGVIAGLGITNVYIKCVTSAKIKTYTVGGTVSNLTGSGLILQNNASDDLPIFSSGPFTFTAGIADGNNYNVSIKVQPNGQHCSVSNGSGKVSKSNVTNVAISCITAYTIGGTVAGLSGSDLVLQNNGGDNLSISGNGTFTLPTALLDKSSYNVTVLSQPANPNQSCAVNNGSGIISAADISNISINCTTTQYTISGNVSGLIGTGLVLQNNSADDLNISADGNFTFSTSIDDGSAYAITVLNQPGSPAQTCSVINGLGTVGSANVSDVTVDCITNSYTVGGTVFGLTGTGLVLQNNAADNLSITASGAFIFTTALDDTSSYDVTVLTQPSSPNQTCTVTNASGLLSSTNTTNVAIACTTNPYSIGGSVSGLNGTGLVLQNNAGDDLSISADGNFTFATVLPDGSGFAVTVKTQPVGQSCAVTNGSGILSGTNVSNISVTCAVPTYSISGIVSGLTGNDLVLQNNSGDDLAITTDGAFTFATALSDSSTYVVTVKTPPTGQFCTVTNGSGTLASANATNVAVSCAALPTYTIGGSVSGLTGTGLVLQNNAGDDLAITVDGTFTFAAAIEEGSTYAVTILTQPTDPNQTCMVVNGSNTVSGSNVTTVAVVCGTSSWGTAALFEADDRINVYDSRVAIDPNGNATIVWKIYESPNSKILAKRFDAATNSWGAAKVITTENLGDAEDPRVAMDANGNAIAMWSQDDGTYRNIWAIRYDAVAGNWGTAILVENNTGGAGGFDEIRLIMHANGNAIAVWPQYTAGQGSIWFNHYDAASGNWGTAELLENDDTNMARSPDIGMDVNGNAIAVWWQYNAGASPQNENVWARHYDATTGNWGTAEVIETFTSLSRETRISMNASGDAVVAWRQYGDEKNIATNRYDATTASWGTATYIDSRTEDAEKPVVAIDTAGNAIVVWEQSDGTSISIWSNRYDVASASWGTPLVLEKVDGSAGVEPRLAMNSHGNAIATWAQYDGVQRSAWVSHFDATAGGWGEAMPIETENRYVWYPEIAMNDNGNAIATWSQRDLYSSGFSGTRDNIWVNHYGSVPVTSYIPTFTIGGSVSGLTGTGLILQNNGGDDLTVSTDGAFTFQTPLYDGSSYKVKVKNQPNGQFCIVSGSGVLVGSNVTDVTSVSVSCEALPSYIVNGSISGLTGTGLVLQNNAGDDLAISASGGFTFATALFGGETYKVTVKAQPIGQACAVTSGSGTITGDNISNVSISCATPYYIGGSVSGLTGSGLVLQNNAGDDVVKSNDGSFTFQTAVVDGFNFDVRVRVQPEGQTCLVINAVGTVSGSDVTSVAVTCSNLVAGEYLVGGSVSGLIGAGLILQNNASDDITISTDGSFTFPLTITGSNSYDVRIKSQPSNPRQTCSITSSAGLIADSHVSDVAINCSTNKYTVRASVSGLKGSGLVIRNNGGDYIAVTGNTNYTFAIALPDTSPYAVSIKTQPSDQSCFVTNGSGAIAGVNVADVMVTCRDAGLYSVGGSVTNMRGSWLGLSNNASDGVIAKSDGPFTFQKLLSSGDTYNVSIGFDAVGQTCAVSNGSGTVSTVDVTSVSVNCVTNAGVNYHTIGGTVSWLKGSGLVLQNNNGDDLEIAADGSFNFPRSLTDGSVYSVSIKKQPNNLNQNCKVRTGSGTLAGTNVTDVSVECITNTYTVRGMITGLEGTGLQVSRPSSYYEYNFYPSGSFYYSGILDGTAFNIRVSQQPTGPNQTCTVINGASTINGGDINNLQVNCVTNQYTIGGTLQGIKGTDIVLSNNGVDDITLSANGAFVFPTGLDDGTLYLASILTQPTGPAQTCLIANNDGALAGTNISNVVVNCNPWTWVSGSDERSASGVFGTQGVADAANVPAARSDASSWKDSSGNFWLFGGFKSSFGGMNDVWKYEPNTGLWTWMKGSQYSGVGPVFGTRGVADPANDPGQRVDTMSWQDASGNFWLFSGNGTTYNDLWKYDTATGNWTWVSGTNLSYESGNYVAFGKGANATPAVPGMRRSGTTWTDINGNLWLFGGNGRASGFSQGRLNDLWKYDPINDLWTWESGADIANQIGVYGTQGIADAANIPGSREEAVSWVDTSGNLWLFGGQGYDSTGTSVGYLNDLWKYDITTGNWTWVSGSNLVNQVGSFGIIGTASASNIPPPKNWALAQTDSSGNFWLYGGTNNSNSYSDLWKYDIVTGLWTWIAGSDTRINPGVYGTLGVSSALNIPGSRNNPVGWFDSSNSLWLFGGSGYDRSGSSGELNDLWKITP